MEITTGNSLLDGIILVAGGIGVGWWATQKSPEQVAAQDRERVRQHETELAQAEAEKIKSANQATVELMKQKHDSFRKAAESLGKSFHNNPNLDPCDAQATMAALAKNFGIIA
jgi:hypothetical protein